MNLKKLAIRCLVFLALLEIVCRAYSFYKIPTANRPHGLEAIKQFITAGSYICKFRGKKYLFKKPKGTYRILALGGSTTIGHISPHAPWPSILSTILNQDKANIEYEVINLGWWGANSAHEFHYLSTYAYLNPDLVILYDGYNDITLSMAASKKYIATTQKIHELQSNPTWGMKFKHILFRQSAIVNRIHSHLYRITAKLNAFILKRGWFGSKDQRPLQFFEKFEWYDHMEDIYKQSLQESPKNLTPLLKQAHHLQEIYRNNLSHIARFLKKRNIKSLFIFQPFLSEKVVRTEGKMKPELYSWMRHRNLSFSDYEKIGHIAISRENVMRQVAKQNGVAYFNAQYIFDAYENNHVYIDNCHYTHQGAEIVAKSIYGNLKKIHFVD